MCFQDSYYVSGQTKEGKDIYTYVKLIDATSILVDIDKYYSKIGAIKEYGLE